MATFKLSKTCASAAAGNASNKGIGDFINGGYIIVYGDVQASDPETAVGAQTVLSNHMAIVSSTSASDGVLTITVAPGTAATGTATWFRCYTSSNAVAFDGAIGTAASDINFAGGNVFVVGGIIAISPLTLTIVPD